MSETCDEVVFAPADALVDQVADGVVLAEPVDEVVFAPADALVDQVADGVVLAEPIDGEDFADIGDPLTEVEE